MNRLIRRLTDQYWFRVLLTALLCISTVWLVVLQSYFWFGASICLLILSIIWQIRLYRSHVKQVLFMIDTLENNDNSFRFPEENGTHASKQINRALNRVGQILYNVKAETAQQEKYYELILDFVSTGLIVLNDNGAVYQKNKEALRLLGLNVFTHVRQLSKVDTVLMKKVENCHAGDKLQVMFQNERGTVNLSIRVSDINVHDEHLRILALSDINVELDEKEIDSWIRLTRVLTHEIMNSVTPITSLSDTLLSIVKDTDEEISRGLQTISATGKGLLSFVESYRKFTRIPTPEPSLFYLKAFIERMVELARHQNPCEHITFRTEIVPADLILYADENLISQVVINLLKNAIQAIGNQTDGEINIQAYCNEAEEIWIEIKNNGPAIPADIAEHIFIPFFTTKEGGSGIGLSISRQIMRLSGGSLNLLPDAKEIRFILKFK
ncbi:PAS domain-containing sensor histidine kinase [uncultured Bacteroides sp.]|uniref:sensor histidine kinase n=1 Tax=uncultured Bacteroides sp. TaxID=162156 RepID=UPI0025ECC812|nr:ATP-binding protein [uncultured Bacteroides sp.]